MYSRLDTLRDDSAIRAWMAQLTRRVCLDRVTARATEPLDEAPDDQVDRTIEEIDEAFTVRQALERLGEPCHELLDRFFARDESYRTIGAELGLPAGTIASRISRCLEKLRGELEGRNVSQPASGDR